MVSDMSTKWTAADVPDQTGRIAVITGANSGIGYSAAQVLAAKGAHVVLAVRNLDKGKEAAERITAGNPKGDAALQELDLSSLDSVRTAATRLRDAYPRIDLLINNAGVMFTPRALTKDGFELQFGTNHLGHFALTGLLLDRLLPVDGSRVVTISSNAHKMRAKVDFDNLRSEHGYSRMAAYGRSKLANLLFTYELQHKLTAAGARTIAVAAHPGGANTQLTQNLPSQIRPAAEFLWSLGTQPAEMGAWPTLRAATDPTAKGGDYYGPEGFAEQRGHPKLVRSSARSRDEQLQRRLWDVSEELTGVTFPL